MLTTPTLTRRAFVQAGGALCVSVAMPGLGGAAPAGDAGPGGSLDATKLASWLEIRSDGTVIARTGRTETGTGMSGFYPQMIAEELGIRPEVITLITGHTDETPDGGWSADFINGVQNLRKVAAYTHQALLGLASTHLGVPASSMTVANGVVTGGGRSVAYADLVKGQRLELTVPVTGGLAKMNPDGSMGNFTGISVTGNPPLKSVKDYTVIGTSHPMPSIPAKVTGKTIWTADIRLPGMLHARMVRPATVGSTLVSLGTLDKAKFPTAEVVRKGNLVAVVSPDEWEAVSAARSVAATTKWTEYAGLPGNAGLSATLRTSQKPVSRGDEAATTAALAGAAKVVSVTYEQPFVKHAPIGPYIAVADVKADGTVTIHSRSTNPQGMRAHIAYMLGTTTDKVTVRWSDGAGQYGRGSFGGDGAEADAVILSQLLGKPVRVQWTLQEDLTWSTVSPAFTADLKAGLDANGRLVALQSDWWGPTQMDARMLGAVLAGLPTLKPSPVVGPASFHVGPGKSPWSVAQELHRGYGMASVGSGSPSTVGIRGNIMRTPGQRQNILAFESLINEAAAAVHADALQFRLDHSGDRRMQDILRKTAEAAGWQSRPSPNPAARRTGTTPVKGRGIAALIRFGAYWVGIADVEVTPATGKVVVTHFTMGVEPGKIINPRQLKLIMEGGVVMGLGETMSEEVTFDSGKVTSTDWTKYRIPTMGDIPEIRIVQMSRDDVGFGGGGEAANAVTGPAVLAAVFDATGVQPRRTPLTPAYVQGLLKA